MHTKVFLIDLDDTLYARSSGLWPAIKHRISLYMIEKMKMPVEEVPAIRKYLFETYGTTLRGLKAEYDIDEMAYLDFVHDVNHAEYLQPDLRLREMLEAYPQKKFIFTNADKKHADRVIDALGLNGLFEEIIDILAIWPYCKPQKEAFEIALKHTGLAAVETVFIDDSPANIVGARALGFQTVLIAENGSGPESLPVISSLHHLPSLIPQINQ